MLDTTRREEIRSRILARLGAAARLRDLVTDPDVRERIERVRVRLTEVETFFIDQLDDRTPQQEALWLGTAERALQWHTDDLQYFEDAVAEYGPGVALR